MGYEFKLRDLMSLAGAIGAETREKGDELFFRLCPFCGGGLSGDKDTFSVNTDTGVYKCFRSSCGAQGHFVQLARHVGFELDFGENKTKKTYRRLPQRPVVVRDPAVAYMASRGIGEAVTRLYEITTQTDRDNILVFPFRDDEGEVRFVKYRKTDFDKSKDKNKEWSEPGCEPILFGMWQCWTFDTLVITEGQLDSLSLAEAGITNPVSVPTGAMGATWIEACYDWVSKFRELVIFGDCEGGKVTLVDMISKRFSMPIRVVQPEDYYGEKDANDMLRKYGKDLLVQAVNNAKPIPVDHVKRLADVEAVNLNELEKITTKIPEVDRAIGGLYFGQVVLLTGKRGEGKSTLMSQLVLEARDQGYNAFIYSGELPDYQAKAWMDLQAAGVDYINTTRNVYGDQQYSVKPEAIEKINDWYGDHVYLFDNSILQDDESEMETLLATMEKVIRRNGVRAVFIDNLMTAMDVEPGGDLYHAQSVFLKRLKTIAMRYDVMVLLVAHPRKTQRVADNDDVSGSGDITNRVDTVLIYSRADPERDGCSGKLAITKNRLTGKLISGDDAIKLAYSRSSRRVTSVDSGLSSREYGWIGESETIVTGHSVPF